MDEEGRAEENLDSETGEIRQTVICLRSERLAGEADRREPPAETRRKKKSFQVPISYVQGEVDPKWRRKKVGKLGKLRVDSIEEKVINGTQNVSPIVFMLPTLLIFPAWTSVFCILCEACIHMLSHKRNKMQKYRTDYKSPLHVISSEFCVYCRSHRWKEKIRQIQDKRSMRRRFIQTSVVSQA